jgi:hypothetical protein
MLAQQPHCDGEAQSEADALGDPAGTNFTLDRSISRLNHRQRQTGTDDYR